MTGTTTTRRPDREPRTWRFLALVASLSLALAGLVGLGLAPAATADTGALPGCGEYYCADGSAAIDGKCIVTTDTKPAELVYVCTHPGWTVVGETCQKPAASHVEYTCTRGVYKIAGEDGVATDGCYVDQCSTTSSDVSPACCWTRIGDPTEETVYTCRWGTVEGNMCVKPATTDGYTCTAPWEGPFDPPTVGTTTAVPVCMMFAKEDALQVRCETPAKFGREGGAAEYCLATGPVVVSWEGVSGYGTQLDADVAATTAKANALAAAGVPAGTVAVADAAACVATTAVAPEVTAPVEVVTPAPATVTAPAAATVAAPAPAAVSAGVAGTAPVADAATVPASVPAGDGSQAPTVPIWALAMIVVGVLGMAAAGRKLVTTK